MNDIQGMHAPRRRRMVRWGSVVALVLLGGLVASACGGGTPTAGQHRSTTTNPPPTTSTTAVKITTPTVTLNGTQVAVPTDTNGAPVTSTNAYGQNAIYTTTGFLPQKLWSADTLPVVFTNLSRHAVTITFESTSGAGKATLAPGQAYTFVPKALQFTYSATTGAHAIVVYGAFT